MANRILILGCLFFFSIPFAHAVKLGELHVRSLLNEPLDAKIVISNAKDIDPAGLIVRVADREMYAKEGLEPFDWVYKIDIETESDKQTGKIIVKLTSQDPIKDPYADLLVLVTWQSGKIVREYTLLLDPPRVAVPTSLAPVSKKKAVEPLKNTAFQQEKTEQFLEPKPILASAPVSPSPGKLATTIKRRANLRRKERATSRVVRPGSHYGSQQEDTLWNIANKLVKDTPYSVNQGVAAITNKNPEAFKDGNLNSFINKSKLVLPNGRELASFSEEDAQYFIDAQNEDWEQGYVKVSQASALDHVYPERATDAMDSAMRPLRLVAPELEGTNSEALDTLKRTQEAIELNNQLLKDQNATLAQLLAQKDKEIEQLRLSASDVSFDDETEIAEPYVPGSRSSSVKFVIFLIFVGMTFLFSISIGYILLRDKIHTLLNKWKYAYWRLVGSSKAPPMATFAAFSEVRDTVSFDIERALAVLSQEEKRYLNLKVTKDSAVDAEVSLEEVDAMIAYEKFAQARKTLKAIILKNPENWEAFLKLLELYVMTENYDNFVKESATLPPDFKERAPDIWAKIVTLKAKVNNEKAIKLVDEPLPIVDVSALIAQAKSHIEAGNYLSARECLTKANITTDITQKEEIQRLLQSIPST